LADNRANGIANIVGAVAAANTSTEFDAHGGTLCVAVSISDIASLQCEGIQPIAADACAFTPAISVPDH
jgi:hypothetical protein